MRPRRILVAGTSGSGKTTVARLIAAELDVPHTELDSLFHGPGWVPRASFEADVDRLAAQQSWVTEWQYSSARPRLLDRADLLVWLDLPTAVVMRQVVVRTISRRVRRQELWNGNREGPLHTVVTDRDHVVRWAWRTRHRSAEHVAAARESRPRLAVVRLRSRAQVRAWLAGPLRDTLRSDPGGTESGQDIGEGTDLG